MRKVPSLLDPNLGLLGGIFAFGSGFLLWAFDGSVVESKHVGYWFGFWISLVILLYVGVSSACKWLRHCDERRTSRFVEGAIEEAACDPILIFDMPEMKPPSSLPGAAPRDHVHTAYCNYLRAAQKFHPEARGDDLPNDFSGFTKKLDAETATVIAKQIGDPVAAEFHRASARHRSELQSDVFISDRFLAWRYCRKQFKWLDNFKLAQFGPDTGWGAGL